MANPKWRAFPFINRYVSNLGLWGVEVSQAKNQNKNGLPVPPLVLLLLLIITSWPTVIGPLIGNKYKWILKLGTSIAKQDTTVRKAIPAQERLALTLRFLATGDSLFLLFGFEYQILRHSHSGLDMCWWADLNFAVDLEIGIDFEAVNDLIIALEAERRSWIKNGAEDCMQKYMTDRGIILTLKFMKNMDDM
ncbi:hypothetical protein NQ317_018506 [Molorchus minor]|uniref:Uncharacterized protein n=1 Tax=Molorchus minor TaxID=1323400 RepID=A0ABQ9JAU8_9CUCU|nr:hypothetical protein NQ317_018506 [Molorchus minor]